MIRWFVSKFITPLDPYLLILLGCFLSLSLAVLYSASGQNFERVGAQLVNMSVALAIMFLIINIPIRYLQYSAIPLYLLGIILLLGVALFGDISHGARRWLHVGVTRIQPSEIMKLAVPLMLAWYFDRRQSHSNLQLKDFVFGAIILIVPVVFVAKQPDLGTALLIASAGCYVIFFAGLSWRVIAVLITLFLASLPVFWSVLHDYQRQRVLTLLDPTQDPLGTGYHIIQSTIAVGSGGIFGKGWLKGTQTHLEFLPERTTDFIFAVFSEEFGLIGCLLLLVLYILTIARGLWIASHSETVFTRLLAGGISLIFFTYAFVNMGMVSGILPVVGVPLPLMSYGGTSLVTMLFSFGILMNIQSHHKITKKHDFDNY